MSEIEKLADDVKRATEAHKSAQSELKACREAYYAAEERCTSRGHAVIDAQARLYAVASGIPLADYEKYKAKFDAKESVSA